MNRRWLGAGRLAVVAIAMAFTPLAAQQTARQPDVSSPEGVVTALYRVISGPASRDRDWDRFRSLFLPGARLVFLLGNPGQQQQLYNLTVDEFIELAGPGYQSGAGFWEREIGSHVDRFGTIAQVFSTYETRLTDPNGPVAERGINGVQLLRHQDRWWITSLVFDTQTAANPIPPRYLGNP
jgi:hypothetical protein